MKYLKYFEARDLRRNYNIDNIIISYLDSDLSMKDDNEEEIEEFEDLTVYDINDGDREKLKEEIEWFIEKAGASINLMTDDQLGYDLYLTRNGHGAGFWDRGYPEEDDELLCKLSDVLGETYLYKGDDGKLYYNSSDKYKEWDFEKYKEELRLKKDIKKYNI